MKRKVFIKRVGCGVAGSMLFPPFLSQLMAGRLDKNTLLPWYAEKLLREKARSVFIRKKLHPTNPQPCVDAWPQGPSLPITNPTIRSTLWGPANRLTISANKNDIWDRRVDPACYMAPTLKEIIDGANAPVNKDFNDLRKDSTREANYGYLTKEGGKVDPYQFYPKGSDWGKTHYPFPGQKTAGQIILGMDDFEGAQQPELEQSCANGMVKLTLEKDGAKSKLEYILSMDHNLFAIRNSWSGLKSVPWFRLFRHKDTAHYSYMSPDGEEFTDKENIAFYEKDRSQNVPIEPPTCGQERKFFWIHQRMPAEKTFPKGFEYVMMGLVDSPSDIEIINEENQQALGTPVPNKDISEAPGWAATARMKNADISYATFYVTIITTLDANNDDIMAVAKKKLIAAKELEFKGIVSENERWFTRLYCKRENGRIFYDKVTNDAVTKDIQEIFYSWYCLHGGGTLTDMQKYQASAHYASLSEDIQPWYSLPCYNEVCYTHEAVRNRTDSTLMWKEIIKQWGAVLRENAKEMFDMPGMYLGLGYLPPITPDKYVHTCVSLELAIDVLAQTMKPLWDEWDYGGDEKVLREIYPYMRDMAIFYAAYAKQNKVDGIYHFIPSMQCESFGIQPKFSHSKDTISAICMVRWALLRTAEASVLLDVDADTRNEWLEIANNLPPYPTWQKPEGLVFAAMPGIEPWRGKEEHDLYIGTYPTILADEITLDSDNQLKETMIRTAQVLFSSFSNRSCILLGKNPSSRQNVNNKKATIDEPERLLNSRSGRIYLFPCLPENSSYLAFRNFQTRGGFMVSAIYDGKTVVYTTIQSRRKTVCKLMNPWPNRNVKIIDADSQSSIAFQMDRSNGECLIFDTEAMKTYQVIES